MKRRRRQRRMRECTGSLEETVKQHRASEDARPYQGKGVSAVHNGRGAESPQTQRRTRLLHASHVVAIPIPGPRPRPRTVRL